MIAALVVVLALQAGAIQVSGTVRDPSDAVVAGAVVAARLPGGAELRATTGPDGRFTLEVPADRFELHVRSDGFSEYVKAYTREDVAASAAVDIVLSPAALLEEVTVTASRREQRLGDVPASVNVVTRDDIRQSPAVVADDVLRQVPTFSLFRRSSSLSSHPTSQGVSLRGIGPSGVSRTLVLLDGVPFNDPFGGWVYWSRVPLEAADRIEVVDGSGSSLYGNYAMGGVINIVTNPPVRRMVEISPQYGSRNTPKLEVAGSDVWGKVGVAVDGALLDTDGFPIVAPGERGAVDNNATVNFQNINTRIEFRANSQLTVYGHAGYFREHRHNGKASTVDGTEEKNDTSWGSASGGMRVVLPDASALQATIFGDNETFHSNFLAVPAATPPRSIGRMTLNQTVPTTGVGALAQWSKAFSTRQIVTVGADWRHVDGDSEEDGLDPATGTRVVLRRVSGGTQQIAGAFVQDVLTPVDRFAVTLSARFDSWRSYDAHNLEMAVPSGAPTANNNPSLPERSDTAVSPHAGAIYHFSDRVSAWGGVGWGFRAPTLNELYRQFRVGTVLTLANNQLGPERLVGGEAGLNVALMRNATWRTTWFDNSIKNPVSNVTLTTVGANVTQQRQNLGRTSVWGVQSDVEYRIGTAWRFYGAYLYDHATVEEFAANPSVVGKFLPQVPSHRGSLLAVYSNATIGTLTAAVQMVGRQFDDDQNVRVVPGYGEPGLPKYALVNLNASRAFGRTLEIFGGVQNLFDRVYFVGTLPTTIGSPRLATIGVRVRFTGR